LGHSSQLVSAEQIATAGIFKRKEYAIYREAIPPDVGPNDGLIGTRRYVPVGRQLEALWKPVKLKGFGNALLI
jgi:hypothetical protein